MFPLLVILILFFLCWSFCLKSSSASLVRLGKTLSHDILKTHRFYYHPLHRTLFKPKKGDFDLLVLTHIIDDTLAKIGYTVTSLLLLLNLPQEQISTLSLAVIALFLLVLLLFVTEVMPPVCAKKNPEKTLLWLLPLGSFFLYLSLPFSFLFLKLAQWMCHDDKGKEAVDQLEDMKETIAKILQSADVKGKLDAADKKLIESVIKFKDRIVREVMVPRADLFSLPTTTSLRKAAELLAIEGYSRTPVYKGTLDNIIGMLMFKDILEIYMDCESGKKEWTFLDSSIETIAKGVFYTPETTQVSHLLQDFRNQQMHMAIVVNEYGGTEGVVTIEDILEEIVGEIDDEYDIEEETLYTTLPGEGSWIVDASMSIRDAEETFDIQIPQEGDYETIGGYILHTLGIVPPKGYKMRHANFEIEILFSTERSVEKVRITPIPTSDSE